MSARRHLMIELRRRNVPRALVAYWVVAWTCIEVGSVIEQALLLPEWTDLAIVILSITGLPIVVAVSWYFEWAPDGLAIDCRDAEETRMTYQERQFASQIAREVYDRLANAHNYPRRNT